MYQPPTYPSCCKAWFTTASSWSREWPFEKAKGRGLSGGYGPSLGITALSECIRRVDAGDDVEIGVIVEALELLGLHLERDEAGTVVVCEN